GDRRVVRERAVADRGHPTGEMDAAAESVVGAVNAGCRVAAALVPVAADGLIVVERTAADHQHRRVPGPAAQDGAADPRTRTDRAGAVVAADRLVVAERAVGDGQIATVVDASAGAGSGEAAGAEVAGQRHVMSELTVADAGGGNTHDGAAQGTAGRGAVTVIGTQGLVSGEGTAGDGQRAGTEVGDGTAEGGADPPRRAGAGIADGLVVGQNVVGERQAAEIQDPAADAGENGRAAIGQAVRHRHPGEGDGHAGTDVEDPAGTTAANGELLRARSFDVQAFADGQLAVGQPDGLAEEARSEVDGVTALGGGDLAAQRAVASDAGVEVAGHRECAGHGPVFQGFEPGHDAKRARALRPMTRGRVRHRFSLCYSQPRAEK